MRRITLTMLCILFIASLANATSYFVDFSKTDDTGDGTTWETAKKTISAASALGATGDDIYLKAGTLNTTAQVVFVTNKNYYGSCDASNTGTTTVRSKSDLDANGVVEPWEFTTPTLLSSTYANSNAAFTYAAATRIDGFVFTLTYLSNATNAVLISGAGITSNFTNNTIRNCNMACKVTGSFWSLFLTITGTASNCLIENNKLAITSTATFNNGTGRGLVLLNAGAKASNFIIRNNLLNCDFSTVAPTATANGNMIGLILHVGGTATTTLNTVVKNVVINNNEINYIGSTVPALPTATRAAVLSCTSNIATDSILNCTVVNNKTTNLYSAGISINSTILQLYNNVAYNNQNGGLLSNITIPLGYISTGGLVSNNITNGAGLINGTRITNNDSTQTATDNSVFKFKDPTNYVGLPALYAGNPVGQSSIGSNWSLINGSYLAGKGLASSNLYDMVGNAITAPAPVGAYTFVKLSQSITFGSLPNKKYGDADFSPAATSSANTVTYTSSNTAVATIVSNQIHIVGVGTTTITATQPASAFYDAAVNVTQTLTVDGVHKFFVDFSKTDDTGDGFSWETAKKTIAAASALGVAGDSIYIKAGTLTTAAQVLFVTNRNYYGSCDAANTGTTIVRSTSDLDANGVVEPWEFTNPTLLTSTYGGYNGAFTYSGNTRVDGFVFTYTYLANSTSATCITSNGGTSASIFTNNTIRNCNIASKVTGSFWSLFLTITGTASNCLIENNKLAITSTATFNNGTSWGLVLVNSGSKLSNFIVRNNLLNYDFSTILSTATANTNVAGLIVHLTGGGNSVVKNLVINNNEINYTGSTVPALPTATEGAVLSCSGTVATDSILNCTVTNNKTTNLFSAGIYFRASTSTTMILQGYNNVAFNNQNNSALSNISSKVAVTTGGLLSNNYTNGAGLTNATRVTNNDNTQAATDNSAFKFSNPTNYVGLPSTYVGVPYGQSAVGSLWSLTTGSYLAGKGLVASNSTDITGVLFGSTRAVGAYAFASGSTAVEELTDGVQIYSLSNALVLRGLTAGDKIVVSDLRGIQIKSQIATDANSSIALPTGVYLVRVNSLVKKVVVL